MATEPNTTAPTTAPSANGPIVVDRDRRFSLFMGIASLLVAGVYLLAIAGVKSRHGDWNYLLFIGWAGLGLGYLWIWKSNRPWAIIAEDGLTCPWHFWGTLPWRFVRSCERQLTRGLAVRVFIDPLAYEVVQLPRWLRMSERFDIPLPRMTDDEADRLLTFCNARIVEAGR